MIRIIKLFSLFSSTSACPAVFAVCLESDDENLLVPMKIYKIGLRGDKARVVDEEVKVAVYPLNFFLVLSLAKEAANLIEKHNTGRFKEKVLV